MAASFQVGADVRVIEDLPVENGPDRSVLVADRLLAPLQVDDGEAGAALRELTDQLLRRDT